MALVCCVSTAGAGGFFITLAVTRHTNLDNAVVLASLRHAACIVQPSNRFASSRLVQPATTNLANVLAIWIIRVVPVAKWCAHAPTAQHHMIGPIRGAPRLLAMLIKARASLGRSTHLQLLPCGLWGAFSAW